MFLVADSCLVGGAHAFGTYVLPCRPLFSDCARARAGSQARTGAVMVVECCIVRVTLLWCVMVGV